MTTPTVDLSKIHATVHIIYVDCDSYTQLPYESIFSFPARVTEYKTQQVTVEEIGVCEPRRFTFYLIQHPNGMKSWEVNGEEAGGADDIRLSLVFDVDY